MTNLSQECERESLLMKIRIQWNENMSFTETHFSSSIMHSVNIFSFKSMRFNHLKRTTIQELKPMCKMLDDFDIFQSNKNLLNYKP